MTATQIKGTIAEGNQDLLSRLVRFAIDVTKGLSTVSEEQCRQIIDGVVSSGKMSSEEGQQLCNSLVARMARNKERFEKRVEQAVNKSVEEISKLSSKELDHIRLKIEELSRRVDHLN